MLWNNFRSYCFNLLYYCMECRTHTKTPARFSILNLCSKVFQRTFGVMHNKVFQKISSCTREAHVEKQQKTTRFQMSNQRLGVNQLLGVTPNCWPTNFFFFFLRFSSFFFVFLRVPYVSLSCEWWKRYFFTHFWVFLIVFNHGNAWASMRSLNEIHNNGLWDWL